MNLVYLDITPTTQGNLSIGLYGSFPGVATLYTNAPNLQSWAMCSTTVNGSRQPSVQSVSYVSRNELVLNLNIKSSNAEWCDYKVNFDAQENTYASNTLGSVPTQISGDHQIGVGTSSTLCLQSTNTATPVVASCASPTNTLFLFQIQSDGSYTVQPQIGNVTLLFSSQSQVLIKDLGTGLCLQAPSTGDQITESFCISTNASEVFSIM